MELRSRLVRWSLARPHVLLVAPVAEQRWHVEAALARRGWPVVAVPADADVVLTVGTYGPDLDEAVDRLWAQVPRPRHRAHVDGSGGIEQVLDESVSALGAPGAWTVDPQQDEPVAAHEMGHDSGGHHDMGDVAGLPMAGTAADRDGLELDALTVHLGPVLPGWPSGLVIAATLQGDVLTDVRPSVLGRSSTEPVPRDGLPQTMHALEALQHLLVVAGWTTAARDAALLRSDLWRAGGAPPDLARKARGLVRKVTGSRTLRWALRDLPGVLSRMHGWCDAVTGGLDDTQDPDGTQGPDDTGPTGRLPELVPITRLTTELDGLDLGSARLVVASLRLDLAGSRSGAGLP